MASGIFFLISTGILWVILGAVVSRAGRMGQNLSFIQGGAALLITALTLPWIFFSRSPVPSAIFCLLPIAGIANYFTFILMGKAMKSGPNGMIWAMVQCAFVMPFLMGITFFKVPASPLRITGIVLLLFSMLLMGLYGKGGGQTEKGEWKWLFLACGAFFFAALGQCCANLPSYLIRDIPMDQPMRFFRTGLSSCGLVTVWLIRGCFDRKIFLWHNCMTGMILTAVSTLLATWCLYAGLDDMAEAGSGAIGYPLCMGVTIAVFQIYSRLFLKEKMKLSTFSAIIFSLIAILLISL